MADQNLYLFNLWLEWEPNSKEYFCVKLSRPEEQRLRESLTMAVKEELLVDFWLERTGTIGMPVIVDYLRELGLGECFSPKNWSPKSEKR